MRNVRFRIVLAILTTLGITGTMLIKEHLRIRSLRESKRRLASQYQELSNKNASLLSVDAERDAELNRLQGESLENLRLRSQLAQARTNLAAAATGNQASESGNSNKLTEYLTREQLKFTGFGSPENAFESLNWAQMNGDYTNWLAALSPQLQDEELANSNSVNEFQGGLNKITGMQVLAAKTVGSDRTELKVRVDTENSVTIFIYPMVAVGNEWRLGDDIDTYTTAWDNPSSTQ